MAREITPKSKKSPIILKGVVGVNYTELELVYCDTVSNKMIETASL
jgi:hypothetical protein